MQNESFAKSDILEEFMRTLRFLVSCLVVFIGSLLASAQIVQQKGGYLINVKYTKGEVLRQDMGMRLVGDTRRPSTSQVVTKCLGVDKNGLASLEVTVPSVGKTPAVKKQIKVDRHGKPLGATIEGYSGTFVWPESPIKMGKPWIGDMSMAAPTKGGMSMKSTYKLVGIKTINGVKVAVITSVMNVSGNYNIAGAGTLYVRFSDGQLHSAEFNLALDKYSASGAPGKLKVVMTIRTLP